MKKILIIAVISLGFIACSKQFDIPPDLTIGHKYNIKGNVFNSDAYPICPCRLDSLFIGFDGVPYANIYGIAHSNNATAQYPDGKGGVRDSIPIKNGQWYEWSIPQSDLKR